MNRLLVLAVAGLVSVTASAANWVEVAYNNSLTQYVDTHSITKSGSYRTAFTHRALTRYMVHSTNRAYNSSTALLEFDCRSNPKKYTILSLALRDNGAAVYAHNSTPQKEWDYIYPDTVNHFMAEFVCSY